MSTAVATWESSCLIESCSGKARGKFRGNGSGFSSLPRASLVAIALTVAWASARKEVSILLASPLTVSAYHLGEQLLVSFAVAVAASVPVWIVVGQKVA